MTLFPEHCGLLVVGHGSREEVGVREFLLVVEHVRRLAGQTPVEPCFLEFAEPSIGAGFQRLVAGGVRHVIVVPALLFSAGHAKRDIPEAVALAAANYAMITVSQAEHLGAEPRLLKLSQRRYQATLPRADATGNGWDTLLVLTGRGSFDADATIQMHAFAEARFLLDRPVGPTIEVAFIAMAAPRLPQVLERAASGAVRRIVVQPHLLFGGVLLDRIADTVRDFAARYPQHEWLVATHLGPDELVAEALLARAAATLSSP